LIVTSTPGFFCDGGVNLLIKGPPATAMPLLQHPLYRRDSSTSASFTMWIEICKFPPKISPLIPHLGQESSKHIFH
jgi:hypothetical protein